MNVVCWEKDWMFQWWPLSAPGSSLHSIPKPCSNIRTSKNKNKINQRRQYSVIYTVSVWLLMIKFVLSIDTDTFWNIFNDKSVFWRQHLFDAGSGMYCKRLHFLWLKHFVFCFNLKRTKICSAILLDLILQYSNFNNLFLI